MYFGGTGRPPPTAAVTEVLSYLADDALGLDAPVREVHTRIAAQSGRVVLDLGDGTGRVAFVTRDRWIIGPCPDDLRFRRSGGALPEPIRGDRSVVDVLRDLLPGLDAAQVILAAAWLMAPFLPSPGHLPVLVIGGPQGSGKSTAARVLRWTIDPTQTVEGALGGAPREVRDLAARAKHHAIVALDNLSFVGDDLSDALCTLVTGGDLGARAMFTNDGVTTNALRRPVLITGIDPTGIVRRPDLMDRAIVLRMPALDRREPETALWARVEAARPALLAGLLDGVARALRDRSDFSAMDLRLADFTVWSQAAGPALGYPPCAFVRSYQANRGEAAADLMADDPLAASVAKFTATLGPEGWTGSMSELRAALDRPEPPAELGRRLTRMAPVLSTGRGVIVQRLGHSRSGSLWTVRPVTEGTSP